MALDLSGWLPNLLPVLIKAAGVAQTARRYVNFVGVTATDDAANDQLTITVSSGTTPTGTGIPHIVGGVQDAAASLIVNADVHASAAIAGSKIAADFSAQTLTLGQILGGTPQVEATTGVVNNLALGAGVALLRVTGTLELTGIAAPSGRRVLLVEVADTGSFTFDHQDGRSNVTAQYDGVGTAPLSISARGGAVLLYETGVGFWRCIAKNT